MCVCVWGGEAGISLPRRRHYASLPRALAQGTGTQRPNRALSGRIVNVALLRQRNTMREITHTSNTRRSRVAVCRRMFFEVRNAFRRRRKQCGGDFSATGGLFWGSSFSDVSPQVNLFIRLFWYSAPHLQMRLNKFIFSSLFYSYSSVRYY